MKPIPTLARPLPSVDLSTREPFDAQKERTDACAVPAAAVVAEAAVAFVLADALLDKTGGDTMDEGARGCAPTRTALPPGNGAIWLVGMMGSGKSTVGRLLAEGLGRRFIDMDQAIEADAGRTISEIFAAEGEAGFRAREAGLIARLDERGGDAVIATGGGAPCALDAMAALQRAGLVVWLRVDVDEVFGRIDIAKRPLLAGDRDAARMKWVAIEVARRSCYARADVQIERGHRDSRAVADELARWLDEYGEAPLTLDAGGEPAVDVEVGERSYPSWSTASSAPRRASPPAWRGAPRRPRPDRGGHRRERGPPPPAALPGGAGRARLPRDLRDRPRGEASKSLERAGEVAERLASAGLDRRSTIVALGGGVVGDLAGFVAAVLYRGIGCVHVPTTLLAMMDSSVGGKTGVNLPSGKNLVGAFHQPLLVFADLTALETLSPRDVSSGLAEVAKHALLEGGPLLSRLEADAERARAGDPEVLGALVAASCALKAAVVAEDERESSGSGGRALLNLGHTVGHALETASFARRARGRPPPRAARSATARRSRSG